ncbi:MAG TPA: tetratricopeptide repeat-containing sensor histidine kinase, partial [Chryseosolibacter sp.]
MLVGTATVLHAQLQKLDTLKELTFSSDAFITTEHIARINKLSYELRVSYPDAAMRGAQRALELSKTVKYPAGECDANVTLGLLYWLSPDFEKSLDHGLRALHLSDSSRYTKGSMEANLLLGLVYNELADFEKAEAFTARGLDLALSIGHVEGTARAYNTLGNHYRRRKQGKEALEFYQKGLDFLEGRNIAIKNLLLNNIALYYMGQDIEREKTRKYLDEALAIALEFENKSAEILTHSRMGAFYTNVKDYKRAEDHFRKVERLSLALGNQSALLDVYKGMTTIKSRMGRKEEAQRYENKYLKLKDSLFTLDNARQVAKMETRFETEKKEQQIKILEQEAVIRKLWTNVLVGSALIFAAFGFYIVYLQRSRTRKARQLLETQELLNKKLKEVDSIKSAFFANISHEFRTPLTLILVPLEDEINKRQGVEKEPLLLIKRNATRLLELVNQLLDLSKLEAGKMELHLEAGDMHALLRIIAASFDSLAQHKQIHFQKDINVHSRPVSFDKDKIEKIVTNLLANAFKFTLAHGRVTVEARFEMDGPQDWLVLSVADSGKGISSKEQELVFSSFYRASESTSEGTGLGLSLVKELVRFYGGTVELKSEVNKGSVFTVRLPVDPADAATRGEAGSLEQIQQNEMRTVSLENSIS